MKRGMGLWKLGPIRPLHHLPLAKCLISAAQKMSSHRALFHLNKKLLRHHHQSRNHPRTTNPNRSLLNLTSIRVHYLIIIDCKNRQLNSTISQIITIRTMTSQFQLELFEMLYVNRNRKWHFLQVATMAIDYYYYYFRNRKHNWLIPTSIFFPDYI